MNDGDEEAISSCPKMIAALQKQILLEFERPADNFRVRFFAGLINLARLMPTSQPEDSKLEMALQKTLHNLGTRESVCYL